MSVFEGIENRFALQAKVTTLLTGVSGFYMLDFIHAWSRYTEPRFWWIHAMTMVWAIYTGLLFVAEPLFLHRLFLKHGQKDPAKTLALMHRLHFILLAVSLVAMAGTVAGSHGWFVF